MALVENPAVFLADFGECCTLDGATVRAIFDTQTVDFASGEVLTQEPSALLGTASVPLAAPGQAFVRAGVSYVVRAVRAEPPDALLTRLTLARA
jgi:hypothetical protein